MKRISYAMLATISALVLLFSYRTSVEAVAPQAAAATQGTDASSSGSSGSSGSGSDPNASDSTSSAESDTGSTSDESDTSGSSDSGTSDTTGTSGSTGTSSGTPSTGLADGTYTGSSMNTRFGPVQVQITVSGGQITAAQAVDYPNDNPRDQQINQYAIPRLVSETLSAQSANIDMVSGATYTSDGYIQSLQSAIDQATS